MYKKIIKFGKILDNWLVDFPQHLLTQKNNIYSIETMGPLKLELNIPIDNYTFTLPLISNSTHKFNIYWGDNTTENITASDKITHTYSNSGTYTIEIFGDCKRI